MQIKFEKFFQKKQQKSRDPGFERPNHHLLRQFFPGETFSREHEGELQQRVVIARALANTPELLLADEPTAALDSVMGRKVMELLKQVAREHNTGVLVVTHDHRAIDVFDRIWVMEDGRIKEQ